MRNFTTIDISASGQVTPKFDVGRAGLKTLRHAAGEIREHVAGLKTAMDRGDTLTDAQRASLHGASRLLLDKISPALDLAEQRNKADRTGTAVIDPDSATTRAGLAAAGLHFDRPFDPAAAGGLGGGIGQSAEAIINAVYGARQHDAGGFRGATDFFSAVVSGRHDPRLQAASQGGHSDPLGGFLLPTAIESVVMRLVLENSIFGGRAQFRNMTTREQSFPAWSTENDGANGTYYGFTREWLAETQSATPQAATLEMMTMRANASAIVVKISNDLLSDAPTFEGQLLTVLAGAVEHFQDVDCLFGSGVGRPAGAIGGDATITVSKENGQAAGTILYENCLSMWARLAPQSHRTAIWLTSPSALPHLERMVITIGTGGSAVRALVETNGQYTLLGRPLLVTHKVAAVGSLHDLVLFDPAQYMIALRGAMSVARSEHVGFLDNSTYVRIIQRFDGKPVWRQAYSPGSGHPTVSPYVTLEART